MTRPPHLPARALTQALCHELCLFFVALQFLTRVPVPAWVGWQTQWLQDCLRPEGQ